MFDSYGTPRLDISTVNLNDTRPSIQRTGLRHQLPGNRARVRSSLLQSAMLGDTSYTDGGSIELL
jgi:hypothetical protein